jgi:hypothetical protein
MAADPSLRLDGLGQRNLPSAQVNEITVQFGWADFLEGIFSMLCACSAAAGILRVTTIV